MTAPNKGGKHSIFDREVMPAIDVRMAQVKTVASAECSVPVDPCIPFPLLPGMKHFKMEKPKHADFKVQVVVKAGWLVLVLVMPLYLMYYSTFVLMSTESNALTKTVSCSHPSLLSGIGAI